MKQCPICSFPCLSVQLSSGGSKREIDCVRCGQYSLTTPEAEAAVRVKKFTSDQAANLAGYIRQNPGFVIQSRDLERLRNLPTPSVGEKAANLLIAVGKEFPKPGTPVSIPYRPLVDALHATHSVRHGEGEYREDSFGDPAKQASKWMAIAPVSSPDELAYLLNDFLEARGLVTQKPPDSSAYIITPEGWERIEELKHTQSKSTKAFVAMSFAPELDEFFAME